MAHLQRDCTLTLPRVALQTDRPGPLAASGQLLTVQRRMTHAPHGAVPSSRACTASL
jgi:hypothetical protein